MAGIKGRSGVYQRTPKQIEMLRQRLMLFPKAFTGHHHSDEMKQEMSKQRKGKPRLYYSKGRLGQLHTEETKRKISIANSKPAPWNIGEKNGHWTGQKVGYSGIHKWVAYWNGKPMICDKCEETGENFYDWSNKSGLYKRDLEDWMRLCRKCHKAYDIGRKALGY